MDVSFNNVLEGTRQYFMRLPSASPSQTQSGQPAWAVAAQPAEEGAPARSGAPAPSSRPPSAAAAPPCAPGPPPAPPRPPSEPLEPEPHIIHKATVMREALEKRRERPEEEEESEEAGAVSPPSHFIRKPCGSPPRPLSAGLPAPPALARAPTPRPDTPRSLPDVYRQHAYRPPPPPPSSHYVPGRLHDQAYHRFHYEHNALPPGSPQPHQPHQSHHPRHSPQQTFARISSSMPQHSATARLRETAAQSPPGRYTAAAAAAAAPPPPHNDRVPPIHHPTPTPTPPTARGVVRPDSRAQQIYASHHRVGSQPYTRTPTVYDRQPAIGPRKYDSQQAYPGYRPAPPVAAQSVQNHRLDNHHSQSPYKHVPVEAPVNPPSALHYTARPPDRARPPDQTRPHDSARLPPPPRPEYANMTRVSDDAAARALLRNSYHYTAPSTSATRYNQNASVPIAQNPTVPQRNTTYRTAPVPKPNCEYNSSNNVPQTSPMRPISKVGFPNQQARMTVSVTTLVNQMNQTKHKEKRESPLDLSVKTVKNSADSSTAQDDVDSSSVETKIVPFQQRPSSSTRHTSSTSAAYITSHKVDFSPDFQSQYRERTNNHNNTHTEAIAPTQPPTRYNGTYEARPQVDTYPSEPRQQAYVDHNRYNVSGGRPEYPVQRIDLTRTAAEERHIENPSREDRHYINDESRKRLGGPILNNIPEKIVRYETWSADSRIERMSRSAREQHELMSRPVYSYTSHKRFEAFQNEQKRSAPTITTTAYRECLPNSRYQLATEHTRKDTPEYHINNHYLDRNQAINGRQVIQKVPSNRELPLHHNVDHSGVPADKRVLSILRNSLETKHTGYVEPARPARHIPDLIVIDDVDDSVIEITDLTKDNESDVRNKVIANHKRHISPNLIQKIHIPKAIDSIANDAEYPKSDVEGKAKSPENDVAARIRTKAELKVMPPQDNSTRSDLKQDNSFDKSFVDKSKLQPKSQKQHLFNQIREESLRMESGVKDENKIEPQLTDIKVEPMNIDEIEKDAQVPIKEESTLNTELKPPASVSNEDTLDWESACDSFVEQLKSGCHKKKNKKIVKRSETEVSAKVTDKMSETQTSEQQEPIIKPSTSSVVIKQEPITEDEVKDIPNDTTVTSIIEATSEDFFDKSVTTDIVDVIKTEQVNMEYEVREKEPEKIIIKEESESTDDDEPLIKSKLLKEKEKKEQINNLKLLKELSEKSAYVKLECCDITKSSRRDSNIKENDGPNRHKLKYASKIKGRLVSENDKKSLESSSSDSDSEISVASRLRTRKINKSEDSNNKLLISNKSSVKLSPTKKQDSPCSSTSSFRKQGFGDGSDFHPGWEEELYRYKRSLRMPTRLIAIPRGRSGGPFGRTTTDGLFTRGSTSLPDLDTAPLSPAPSSAPSAATDDFFARRQDKLTLDSDLDSNSSCSAVNRLHYDSEASTSTILSTNKTSKKRESILDVLIQKCSMRDESKRKSKDDARIKNNSKSSPTSNLMLSTPSSSDVKNDPKEKIDDKKENIQDVFSFRDFKNESVTATKSTIDTPSTSTSVNEKSTLNKQKSRLKTENRIMKQRAKIKKLFGDDRPASAPPSTGKTIEKYEKGDNERNKGLNNEIDKDIDKESDKEIDKETKPIKSKPKVKKVINDKILWRSSSIRDGLRSTKSLKRNDAKGRLLRLKKRNNIINSLANKKIKDFSKKKEQKSPPLEDKEGATGRKEDTPAPGPAEGNRKRFKRLFGRRKFSSGFDYIRKKKKIIRKDDSVNKIRRVPVKATPESEHDIHKEIKGWFINKSVGETPLHRAARLGYTDCVAYCLEKLNSDPTSRDNAGFTPLHVAAARGSVRIGRLLLQYGANVSASAQGGIRPLHEASEGGHVEMIRLLLSYGADPLLGTYSGQTPARLAEGASAAAAARLLRLHIADAQGCSHEPWQFPPPSQIIDMEELGCDPLSSPPPPPPSPSSPEPCVEMQCTEAPLPPFYSLRGHDGLWCLLQDITSALQIKSKDSLLKQIHCGSGSPRELLRELRTQEFLERAQCHQLLAAGEKVNVRASRVALVRVTDKLRQLLRIETVVVS